MSFCLQSANLDQQVVRFFLKRIELTDFLLLKSQFRLFLRDSIYIFLYFVQPLLIESIQIIPFQVILRLNPGNFICLYALYLIDALPSLNDKLLQIVVQFLHQSHIPRCNARVFIRQDTLLVEQRSFTDSKLLLLRNFRNYRFNPYFGIMLQFGLCLFQLAFHSSFFLLQAISFLVIFILLFAQQPFQAVQFPRFIRDTLLQQRQPAGITHLCIVELGTQFLYIFSYHFVQRIAADDLFRLGLNFHPAVLLLFVPFPYILILLAEILHILPVKIQVYAVSCKIH